MPSGLRIFLVASLLALPAYWFTQAGGWRAQTDPIPKTPDRVEVRRPLIVQGAPVPVAVVEAKPEATPEVTPKAPTMPKTEAVRPKSEPMQAPEPAVVVPAEPRPILPEALVRPSSSSASSKQAATLTVVPVVVAAGSNDAPLAASAIVMPPSVESRSAAQVEPRVETTPVKAEMHASTLGPAQSDLRKLPEHFSLRYSVQSGDEGFKFGQAVYSGHLREGRYSLTSVSEATGVASLLLSGKIIQSSEGRITAQGLQPDWFSTIKGERKRPTVRFDWPQQRLLLPGGAVSLPTQTQDLLSFPFHLAMRVREGDAAWVMSVTNDKNLRNYNFQVMGREMLTLGATRIETLRVQGRRSGDGSLDVWLAPERQWLPVRIRTLDQQGKVILLSLLEGNR